MMTEGGEGRGGGRRGGEGVREHRMLHVMDRSVNIEYMCVKWISPYRVQCDSQSSEGLGGTRRGRRRGTEVKNGCKFTLHRLVPLTTSDTCPLHQSSHLHSLPFIYSLYPVSQLSPSHSFCTPFLPIITLISLSLSHTPPCLLTTSMS